MSSHTVSSNTKPKYLRKMPRFTRMFKRKAAVATLGGVFTIILIFYVSRGSDESITNNSASNVDNIVNIEIKNEREAEILGENKNEILKFEIKETEQENLILAKPVPAEQAKVCNLDWRRDIFTEKNDGYETMTFTPDEIHEKDFTSERKNSDPNLIVNNPIIRLDPSRFMLPVLIRGPNNQLVGLRESIYVAIRLNRTLVIPRFLKHRTDNQKETEQSIHPAHRVDFQRICQFVSCISLQQFRDVCGRKTDVVFRLRHYSRRRIGDLEALTGTLFTLNKKSNNINLLPQRQDKKKPTIFRSSEKEIRKLFGTSEKCAIYGQPFYNMKLKYSHKGKRVETREDLTRASDAELFSEVIRRTSAPKYIQEFAAKFIRDTFNDQDFIGVHWRYDKQDWMKRCNSTDTSKGRLQLCKEALLIEPQDVAEAIVSKLEKFGKVKQLSRVYIASPPSQKNFISSVSSLLWQKKIISFSLKDLSQYVYDGFNVCDFIESNFNDILSTTEMQICARGAVFMRSTHSSWSSNVIEQRRVDARPGTYPKRDEDILNLTKEQRLKRLKEK